MHDDGLVGSGASGMVGRVVAVLTRLVRWLVAALLLGSVLLVVALVGPGMVQGVAAAAPASAEAMLVGAGPRSQSVDGAVAGDASSVGLDGPGGTDAGATDDGVRVAERAAQDVLADIDSVQPPPTDLEGSSEGSSADTHAPSSDAPDPDSSELAPPPQLYWRPDLDAHLAMSEQEQPTPPPGEPDPGESELPAATQPTPGELEDSPTISLTISAGRPVTTPDPSDLDEATPTMPVATAPSAGGPTARRRSPRACGTSRMRQQTGRSSHGAWTRPPGHVSPMPASPPSTAYASSLGRPRSALTASHC